MMTIAGDLSLESFDLSTLPHPEDAVAQKGATPLDSEEYDHYVVVSEVLKRVQERKSITRADVQQLEPLVGKGYPALDNLLDQYPVNSFTEVPSGTNLDVSTEGFIRTAFDAVIRVLRQIIEYLVEKARSFWRFITNNSTVTKAVDESSERLSDVQEYILKLDPLFRNELGEGYEAHMKRVTSTALHNNIHHKFNKLKRLAVLDPETFESHVNDLYNILMDRTPRFAEAVREFSSKFAEAKTPEEVMAAVNKFETFTWMIEGGDKVVSISNKFGYKPQGFKKDSKVTPFHARANYILGYYRSLSNDRSGTLNLIEMKKVVMEYQISQQIDKVEALRSKTQPYISEMESAISKITLDDSRRDLESVYAEHVAPAMVVMSSTVNALIVLEQAFGMLMAARDEAAASILKAGLQIVGGMDKYAVEKSDKLTVATKILLKRYREPLQKK